MKQYAGALFPETGEEQGSQDENSGREESRKWRQDKGSR